ncbi:FABP family protein [Microbacterium sp. SSW1-59]|uniref:FABP family protein n=1 Tax=Microbacterium xanthum TaxID=3079794 RepID=UPI002AD50D96|nr:FABP family protein [Microbacterium sp. SSW1-59]MDZ8199981.1 FABP family protein [Microbacterium sp. SSW1-59]
MLDLPTDIAADLAPLSWLLGVWEGPGFLDYTAGDTRFSGEFTHRVSFSHDGGDHVNYSADAWTTGPAGERIPLVSEVGFWRLARPVLDTDAGPALLPPRAAGPARRADDVEALRNAAGGFDIQAQIVHSDGVGELYLGQVKGPRIDLATDAVVRTAGAREYAAATRMYGLVEGDLLWAWDIAALGTELRSHASARLVRAP